MQRFTLPRDLYHGKGALEALKNLEPKTCRLPPKSGRSLTQPIDDWEGVGDLDGAVPLTARLPFRGGGDDPDRFLGQ